MSTQGSEPNPAQPTSSLQSMLARLRGMMQTLKSNDPPPGKMEETRPELLPTWDFPKVPEAASPAEPPSEPSQVKENVSSSPTESTVAPPESAPSATPEPPSVAKIGGILCPACASVNPAGLKYCDVCGWIFPPEGTRAPVIGATRVRNRFELSKLIGERGPCQLYQAIDQVSEEATAVAVLIMREPFSKSTDGPELPATPLIEAEIADSNAPPGVERASRPLTTLPPSWPSLAWCLDRVELTKHGAWPRYMEQFEEADYTYLVLEATMGLSLWDAWDDPEATEALRFGWLIQIAATMQELHGRGAVLEALRPEQVLIAPDGRVRITDLTQLLPCPLPEQAPLRATLYSAPELILASEKADARSDLYAFGAMLYALHVGRELTETDFELQGVPKPILQRFADCHPLFGRLISKAFCRDVNLRLPHLRSQPRRSHRLQGIVGAVEALSDIARSGATGTRRLVFNGDGAHEQ